MLLKRILPGIVIDDHICTDILLPDRNRATAHIEKAVYLGSSEAQFTMGDIYTGTGPDGVYDPALSMHYWRLAATRGECMAALRLSEFFLIRPSVVDGNDQVALSYTLLAAREGDGHAKLLVEYSFETRADVSRDLRKARRWYELATRHGFSLAADRLEALSSSYSQN